MKLGTKILMGIASFALVGGVGVGLSSAIQPAAETKADDDPVVVSLTITITVTNYDGDTMQYPQLNYWYTGQAGTYLKNFVQDTDDSTKFTSSLSGIPENATFGCRVALWDNSSPYTERAYYYGASGAWLETTITDSGTLVCSGAVKTVAENSIGTFTYTPTPIYEINKYAVKAGTLDSVTVLDTDVIVSGNTYAVPEDFIIPGYNFGGWYTDEACTVAYAAQTVSSHLTLYGKYTLTADKYIYYVTGAAEATTNYIYSFGGTGQFGDWPGKRVTMVAIGEVHGVLSFNGNSPVYIYKIPFSSAASDTHIVLNVGSNASQTANMALSHQCGYTFTSGADGTDADMGAAIEFLLAAENKRNAVTASTGILAYSVCGISKGDATTLVSDYTGLSSDAQDYVKASYTYTYNGAYDGEHVPLETNISYKDIVAQLSAIAAGDGAGVVNASYASNDVIPMVITIMAIGLVVGCGIIILTKKKRA